MYLKWKNKTIIIMIIITLLRPMLKNDLSKWCMSNMYKIIANQWNSTKGKGMS